jgi:hypothetical protein
MSRRHSCSYLALRANGQRGLERDRQRGGLGFVMSHVYALNDPAAWLSDSLRLDLESQGAKVVDSSQAGSVDVSLSGRIQLCRVDAYMEVGGDLVIDLEVKNRQGAVRHKQIHTHGFASLASEGEFYHALRECRQKFSAIAGGEI